MFLICFVKEPLMKEISQVKQHRVAKGKNLKVTTLGNKGGLGYSFTLKNHVFNIIGCHLQHRAENQEKRNLMSRQVIDEIKMQ